MTRLHANRAAQREARLVWRMAQTSDADIDYEDLYYAISNEMNGSDQLVLEQLREKWMEIPNFGEKASYEAIVRVALEVAAT